MRRLVHGEYNEVHANAIWSRGEGLDSGRLLDLVRHEDPEFLVIVPKEEQDWRATLSNLGVGLLVVEVFVDHRGRRVLRQSGDSPRIWDSGYLTRLMRDGFLARALRLETPSAIPEASTLTLEHKGFVTNWRVVKAKRATYIIPNGTLDLESDKQYVIRRNNKANLEIEVERK
jgi:hypothetical protein